MTIQNGATNSLQQGDWLQSESLLYRLYTIDGQLQNYDEINVTMANGSRNMAVRTDRATQLRAALTRPAGGSERLRERIELVADKLGAMLQGWSGSTADTRDALTAELRAIAALASPQGAEQRQEALAVDLPWPDDSVDCTEPNRADCPRKCIDFCNKLESTPHPEPAATQGVAVSFWPDAATRGYLLKNLDHAANLLTSISAPASAGLKTLHTLLAALSAPTGVQAAQVSDAVATIIRDVCELDPADPDDPAAVCLLVRDLRTILEAALAQPGSAAHGGEDAK